MASGRGRGSMSLGMKLIRFLIVLLNLAFIMVGLILLAIGVFVVRDPKMQQLRPLLNPDIAAQYSQGLSNIEVFAIGLIAVGGVLLLIGFLGRKTIVHRNVKLLNRFSFRLLRSYQRFSIFTSSLCCSGCSCHSR